MNAVVIKFGRGSAVVPEKSAARRAGFSQIELLVVIAVLAILAVILIPIVGGVREQADTVKLLSRLRQCHTAYQMMLGDSGLEQAHFRHGSSGSGEIWSNVIVRDGYLSEPRERYRPGVEHPTNSQWWTLGLNFTNGPHTRWVDDPNADEDHTNPGTFVVFNYALVDDPSNYIVMADTIHRNTAPQNSFRFTTDEPGIGGGIHIDHRGKSSLVFMGGQVERVDVKRLVEMGVGYAYDTGGKLLDPEQMLENQAQ